jgi:hypothetical protein
MLSLFRAWLEELGAVERRRGDQRSAGRAVFFDA